MKQFKEKQALETLIIEFYLRKRYLKQNLIRSYNRFKNVLVNLI